ncbi:hypothetical protein ABFP60_02105 [Clostridioides difficile]
MALIDFGLVFSFFGVLGAFLYTTYDNAKKATLWHKLGLGEYTIEKEDTKENISILTVKIPIGGSFSEISKYESKIEKAYGCKCTIENIEKSKYVSVILEY